MRGKPRGYLETQLQPGVIRHAYVSSGKADVRSIHLDLSTGELRVAVEVPDPESLIRALQSAIEWRDDPRPDA